MPQAAAVDLSAFEALSGNVERACGVRRLQLDAEQRTKFDAAIKASHISATAISKVLAGWGFEISHQVIGRHRKGTCSCGS